VSNVISRTVSRGVGNVGSYVHVSLRTVSAAVPVVSFGTQPI